MHRSWKGQIRDREIKLTLVDPEIHQDFEKAIFKFIEQIISPRGINVLAVLEKSDGV